MTLKHLQSKIISCRKCPRLVQWREKVAREKVKRFAKWDYWGKPVPGFGDPKAKLMLAGLAPAAHGGNRTGRIFTGDRSGDWLFSALYKAGFANQAASIAQTDGLTLINCYITSACRCAPPQNKLLPLEIKICQPYLLEELKLLKNVRVIVGLGKIGFEAIVRSFLALNWINMEHMPKFRHGAEYNLNEQILLIGSFHPSQQNTFTGKLTVPMFDSILQRARRTLNSK